MESICGVKAVRGIDGEIGSTPQVAVARQDGYNPALDEFTARMMVAIEHCLLSSEDSGLPAHVAKGRKALGKPVATGVRHSTAAEGLGRSKPAIEGGKQRESLPVKAELVAL